MKRQIFIHLGEPTLTGAMPEEVNWVVKEPGQLPGPVFHGDLKTASNHANGCRVIVLVSGVEVLLTSVALPNMNRQRLMKAIPFALEEQLASDVEELHFAIGERQNAEQINCAIVENRIMEMWLQHLKDATIQVDVLTTEVFGAPHEEDVWTLIIKSGANQHFSKAILRSKMQEGMALDTANIVPLLSATLQSLTEQNRPRKLQVIICEESSDRDGVPTLEAIAARQNLKTPEGEIIETDDAGPDRAQVAKMLKLQRDELNVTVIQLQELCQELELGLDVQRVDQSFMVYIAEYFSEKTCIDLLQGEYSRKEQLEKLLRPWFPAIGIGSAWLVLQLGLFIADFHQLSTHENDLRSRIEQVYRDVFPDTKNVVDPKLQMERKIAELRQQTNTTADFFSLLSTAGEVLNDTESVNIQTMRYKSETLDLDFEISDLQALDQLKQRLVKETNLSVDILSASSRGGVVEGRMKLQPAADSNQKSDKS